MNAKLENMNVIRMHFALILKAVMVVFVKMDLMVMDFPVFKKMSTNVKTEHINVTFIQVPV